MEIPQTCDNFGQKCIGDIQTGEIYAYAFCNPISSININDLTHSIHTLSDEPELLTDNDEIWKKTLS